MREEREAYSRLEAIRTRAMESTAGPLSVVIAPVASLACVNTAANANIISTWNSTPVLRLEDAELLANARHDILYLLDLLQGRA